MKVYYPATPASDGTSMTPPVNAPFTVHELSDTTFSNPLPLQTLAGTNAAPLTTTAQGVLPDVYVISDNYSHVFRSGQWQFRRDSFDGAQAATEEARAAAVRAVSEVTKPADQAVDEGIQRAGLPGIVAASVASQPAVTAAAAQLAQSDAGLARRTDPGMPAVGEAEDRLAVIRDASGRETWLGARASDGGPTDWAMRHLQDRLGVGAADSPAYLFAITDSDRRMTDLAVRASDGQFPDFVVNRLRPRILEGYDPGVSIAPAPARIYMDAPYVPGSDIFPVKTDMSRAASWGSSSMEGITAPLAAMFARLGVELTPGGKGGEIAEQTAARMGAIPALVTVSGGTIPASGPVAVTTANVPLTLNLRPYKGVLAGIPGTLAYQADPATYTFTRTAAGVATPISNNTPFIPDGNTCRDALNVLWIGKNNITAAPDTADTVIRLTTECFNWLAPMEKRCLVLGHFVNSDVAEDSGQRVQIMRANSALNARYGRMYIDIHAYLCGPQVWVDTGITPTPADLEQQRIGNKPGSLSQDVAHLNGTANTAITNLIAARLTELGWI